MKIIHLPDVHTGHPKVSAELIHHHMQKILYPRLDESVDIVVIGGDFFDTLLDLNSKAAFHANSIIVELREYAFKYKFKIRVLRGTFSHDRYQNQFFEIDGLEENDIVKVFQKPALEYMEDFKIWIMYKPDDLPYDNVWQEMKKLMDMQHIDKVDILINHGYFDHMIPKNIPRRPHGIISYEQIKPYVKGFVLNGHVHTPSVYENIISGGSFERLQHGEEEEKGFFIINYDPSTCKISYEMIKNEYTPLFKTFRPTDDTVEEFKEWLNKLDVKKADKIFIRVITTDTTKRNALDVILHSKYPDAKLQIKTEDTTVDDPDSVKVVQVELPILTRDNICDKLHEFIKTKLDKDMSIKRIDTLLNAEGV